MRAKLLGPREFWPDLGSADRGDSNVAPWRPYGGMIYLYMLVNHLAEQGHLEPTGHSGISSGTGM